MKSTLSVLLLLAFLTLSGGSALAEELDTPPLYDPSNPPPVAMVEEEPLQEEPPPAEAPLVTAQRKAIAALFSRMNKKLGTEKAERFAGHVLEAAGLFGVDPLVVASILVRESRANPSAQSRSNIGLMQVNWKAHASNLPRAFPSIRTVKDLFDPRNNILAGAWIFSCYHKSSGGDLSKSLKKYVGGGSGYVEKVLSAYRTLKGDIASLAASAETP
ncbi:MAG: transglycosylase SLT domain-containing protein [Synergistales bacterium]|jgi:soluble lytic murein transglycosylase-like protein